MPQKYETASPNLRLVRSAQSDNSLPFVIMELDYKANILTGENK